MARLDQLDPRSRQMLEEPGFTWDPKIGMWTNVRAGREISFETVRDRSPEWLEDWLRGKG